MVLQGALVDYHYRRCSVTDLACVGGGDNACLLKGLDRRDGFRRRVKPDSLIFGVQFPSLQCLNRKRNDFGVEFVGISCANRSLMTLKGKSVEFITTKPILLGDHLRARELTKLFDAKAIFDSLTERAYAEPALSIELHIAAHRHARHALGARRYDDVLGT